MLYEESPFQIYLKITNIIGNKMEAVQHYWKIKIFLRIHNKIVININLMTANYICLDKIY